MQLGHQRLLARPRKHGGHEHPPVFARLERVGDGLEDVGAFTVLDLAGHVLAFPFGLDGVHHALGVQRPDVEVLGLAVGAAVAGDPQRILGRLLGIFLAHGTAGGLGLEGCHDAVRRLHGRGQLFAPRFDDQRALLQ